MFNDSDKNSFTLSFDSWSTDRKSVDTLLQYQIDIGSAQKIISSKNLIVAHQTAVRVQAPNKANNVANFDIPNVRKSHVHIDGVRFPRSGVNFDYASIDYLDQNRDLKLFLRRIFWRKTIGSFHNFYWYED